MTQRVTVFVLSVALLLKDASLTQMPLQKKGEKITPNKDEVVKIHCKRRTGRRTNGKTDRSNKPKVGRKAQTKEMRRDSPEDMNGNGEELQKNRRMRKRNMEGLQENARRKEKNRKEGHKEGDKAGEMSARPEWQK
jgi:hypothetical protein